MKSGKLITEQEHAYIVGLLLQRPLTESLPLYLKMTGQKLVPDDQVEGPPNVPVSG